MNNTIFQPAGHPSLCFEYVACLDDFFTNKRVDRFLVLGVRSPALLFLHQCQYFVLAYNYSRAQRPEDDFKMCYALRRGEANPARLGSESIVSRQVGHLFPGLAVPSPTSAVTLLPIFLNVSVRYRTVIDLTPALLPSVCYT